MGTQNIYIGNHEAQRTIDDILKGKITGERELTEAIYSVGRFSGIPHVRSALAKIAGITKIAKTDHESPDEIKARKDCNGLFYDVCSGAKMHDSSRESLEMKLNGASDLQSLAIGYLLVDPESGDLIAPMEVSLKDGSTKTIFLRPDYDANVRM